MKYCVYCGKDTHLVNSYEDIQEYGMPNLIGMVCYGCAGNKYRQERLDQTIAASMRGR